MEELRRLDAKLDSLQGQVSHMAGEMRASNATIMAILGERCTQRGKALEDLVEDHEQTKHRVTTLEADKHKVIGGAMAAGGIIGALSSWAIKYLGAGR
jgi:hypothetical protein